MWLTDMTSAAAESCLDLHEETQHSIIAAVVAMQDFKTCYALATILLGFLISPHGTNADPGF
jgi:hypothetical protein